MEFTLEELKFLTSNLSIKFKRLQFTKKKQVAFLEDLYLLVNDGIPANRAIEMMAQVTKGLTRDVAVFLAFKIAQGQPLAEGMKEWFAPSVVEIIRVGEAGGALAQTLKSAINALSQQGAAIGGLLSALIYPLFVISISCGLIIYLNSTIFVQFRMIKPIEQWPDAGRQLVNLAQIIENWWWGVLLIVVSLIIILNRLMANYTGELRPILDRFPPFSFYRQFTAARLLETLGLLVSNGVVFKSAIKIMQYQANPYLNSHLVSMEHLLSMGKTNIADVLATGLINDQDLMRLKVMAEVKGFEHGLIRMGIRGTELATDTIKLISRIAGGMLLAVGAFLIIIIIRGVFSTGMAMGS